MTLSTHVSQHLNGFLGKLTLLFITSCVFFSKQTNGLNLVRLAPKAATESALLLDGEEWFGESNSHKTNNRHTVKQRNTITREAGHHGGWAFTRLLNPKIGRHHRRGHKNHTKKHKNATVTDPHSLDLPLGIPAMQLPLPQIFPGLAPVELPPIHLPLPPSKLNPQISWERIYSSFAVLGVIVVVSFALASAPGQGLVQKVVPENETFEMLLVSSLGTGMSVAYFVPIALQLPLMDYMSLSYTQYGYLELAYSMLAVVALFGVPGWLYDRHPFRYHFGSGLLAISGVLICLFGVINTSLLLVVVGFAMLGAASETFLVCQDTLIANYFASSVASSLGFQYAAVDLATAFTMCLAFWGLSIIDGFVIGAVACSLSLLASVILSAVLARPGRKQAEVEDSEPESAENHGIASRNVFSVSSMIAFAAVTQYCALSASRTNLTAANSWALNTEEGDTDADWVLVITFVIRSVLGIFCGFAIDKLGVRSKMSCIIVISFVDAFAFALFAFKSAHPLPLWIILQTSENVIQSSAYALLATLYKGKIGMVYSLITGSMEMASCAATMIQDIIVDANNGGFQTAFLVHAMTVLLSSCAIMMALKVIKSDSAMTSWYEGEKLEKN